MHIFLTFVEKFIDQVKTLIDSRLLDIILDRLCRQLIERYGNFENTVVIGVQPRGAIFSDILIQRLKDIHQIPDLEYGKLDITFYRDDVRQTAELFEPMPTTIDFSLEHKQVILVDDVLYTGRTIRAAMDAILDYGRPDNIELLVLINRRFSKEMPIQANYIGRSVDTIDSQKVKVEWGSENKVILINRKDN